MRPRNSIYPCLVCGQDESFNYWEHGGNVVYLHEGQCEDIFRQTRDCFEKIQFGSEKNFAYAMEGLEYEKPKVLILMGAGVSIPYGIPGMNEFEINLKNKLGLSTELSLFELMKEKNEMYKDFVTFFNLVHSNAKPGLSHFKLADYSMRGVFDWIINTNWDMLLEQILENLFTTLLHDRIFTHFIDRWKKQYKIIDWRSTLYESPSNGVVPIYKIHGSPLLWVCPKCSGLKRYKIVPKGILISGDKRCAYHPDVILEDKAILPGDDLDIADKEVWKTVLNLASQSDYILAIGYSGRDDYILNELLIPNREKLWVVKPTSNIKDPIENSVNKKKRIETTADAFFRCFMAVRNFYELCCYDHKYSVPTDYALRLLQTNSVDFSYLEIVKEYYPNLFDPVLAIRDRKNRREKAGKHRIY